MKSVRGKITGIGVYYPELIQPNAAFHQVQFLKDYNVKNPKPVKDIVAKFEEITEIRERRYAREEVHASDMAAIASLRAVQDAGIDPEDLDYIILAHNFGDVDMGNKYVDQVPNLAARVKSALGIRNPRCVAYDILFGCPGWIQAMIQAAYFLRSGDVKKVLVVGTDTVSRVADKSDVDSMLFSDGAGAVVLEAAEGEQGILGHRSISHCGEELAYLKMGRSFDTAKEDGNLVLKMEGRKVFRYAVENVPALIMECLEACRLRLDDVKYVLIHQANGKMLRVMAKRLFELAGRAEFDECIFPMNVHRLGNNSVATIPILLHELMSKQLNEQGIGRGDVLVFASVGAGMHANCLVYRS